MTKLTLTSLIATIALAAIPASDALATGGGRTTDHQRPHNHHEAHAASASNCTFPVARYAFFASIFTETLTTEVCTNPLRVIWINEGPTTAPGCSHQLLGQGSFWDPNRYGGSLTVWANTEDTCGLPILNGSIYSYLRIWVKPSLYSYTYAGQ